MPPLREPRVPSETNFSDFGQLGEAIANAIQSSLRPPQMTTLEAVSHLQINNFLGNEGLEKSKLSLIHVKKTFRVMQRQGTLPEKRWVETTTWFLHLEAASWWTQESCMLPVQDAMNWEVFKQWF